MPMLITALELYLIAGLAFLSVDLLFTERVDAYLDGWAHALTTCALVAIGWPYFLGLWIATKQWKRG